MAWRGFYNFCAKPPYRSAGDTRPEGLFAVPRLSRFGTVPPDLQAVLTAFLEGAPFVLTGPPGWNSLGLGSTAMWAHSLVYNTKRTGDFMLGNQPVRFRRVRFPEQPTPEWFAVDLLESLSTAGLSLEPLRNSGRGLSRLCAWTPGSCPAAGHGG